MELFIGHLTANDSLNDLRRFFKAFEKKATFRIVKLVTARGPVHFGLVGFDSDKLAQKALKRLHASKFNNRRVCVREYQYRAGGNERRALNWREQVWKSVERRGRERREKCRIVKDPATEFSGYDNMAVKYL